MILLLSLEGPPDIATFLQFYSIMFCLKFKRESILCRSERNTWYLYLHRRFTSDSARPIFRHLLLLSS